MDSETKPAGVTRPWYRKKKIIIPAAVGAAAILVAAVVIPMALAGSDEQAAQAEAEAAAGRVEIANGLASQIAEIESVALAAECAGIQAEIDTAGDIAILLPELENIRFLIGGAKATIKTDTRETVLASLQAARGTLQDIDLSGVDLDAEPAACSAEVTAETVTEASDEDVAELEARLDELQADEGYATAEWVEAAGAAIEDANAAIITGVGATDSPKTVKADFDRAGPSFGDKVSNRHKTLATTQQAAQADGAGAAEAAANLSAWRGYVGQVEAMIDNHDHWVARSGGSDGSSTGTGDGNGGQNVGQQNPGGGNTTPGARSPGTGTGSGNTNPGGGNTSPGTNPGGGNTSPGGGNTSPGTGGNNNPAPVQPPAQPTPKPTPAPTPTPTPPPAPEPTCPPPPPGWDPTGGWWSNGSVTCPVYAPPQDGW